MANHDIKKVSEEQKLFLCIALGGNRYLHSSIGEAYQRNEWEFYEAYLDSKLRGNPLISMYSTRNEEKIRQAAGIIEWCYRNGKFGPLDALIKKGYKFAWLFVQRYEQIDFEQFIRAYAKKQNYRTLKEIELFYQNIIVWYLSSREGKPVQTLSVTWQSFHEMLDIAMREARVDELNFSDSRIKENRKEIDYLYETFNIPENPEFDSLGAFLEYLLGVSLRRVYEEELEFNSDAAQQRMFQISPGKYIGAAGGWLKALGVNELDASEQIPFTKKALDYTFLELLYAKKYNRISETEQDLFFIACLYLNCLASLYKEAKQLYLDESKQEYYVEMKLKEAAILQQEAEQRKREREWQIARQKYENERSGLERELREAKALIRGLEQKLQGMDDYTEEVHALREYVYWEDESEHFYERAPSLETMASIIASKRVVIFGGSLSWQQKVKEALPSLEFFDMETKNRDISKTQRADAVFINTSVLSHAFYNRIMKEVSGLRVPLYYLKGQTNVERTAAEIYKRLTD